MEVKKLTSSSGSFDYVKDVSIAEASFDRVLPRQISSGSTRGTQTVGYGSVKIDGSDNRISLESNDTRVLLGDTSDQSETTGMALVDTPSGDTVVLVGRNPGDNATSGLTVFDATNTRRLHAGTYPDGSVKIKLSQNGKDVATAVDDELIWSSDFNTFKIVSSGSVQLSFTATGADGNNFATYTHGLGYIPKLIAVCDVDTNLAPGDGSPSVPLPFTVLNAGVVAVAHLQVTIDENTVYFLASWSSTLGAGTYTSTCYFNLFKESFSS